MHWQCSVDHKSASSYCGQTEVGGISAPPFLMLESPSFTITSSQFSEKQLSSVIHRVVTETKGVFHRSKLGEIFLYLSLVFEGYRDAYLFDGCSATAENVTDLLRITCESLAISDVRLGFSLVTIGLGQNHDDFLVIGSNVLQNKLSNLTQFDWIDIPLIVDVNGSDPRVCSEEEIQSIRRCLISTFSDMAISTAYFPLSATADFLEVVGFPFLAGWLLGYPCVYRSSCSSQTKDRSCNEVTTRTSGNALSMISLLKYSVNAVISAEMLSILDIYCAGAKRKFTSSSRCSPKQQKGRDLEVQKHVIDLLEFTVPKQFIHEGVVGDVDFRRWYAKRFTETSSSGCSTRSSDIFQIFTKLSLSSEEVELPSLIL